MKRQKKKMSRISNKVTSLRFLNFTLAFALVGTLLLLFTSAAPIAGFYGSIEQDQVNRINGRRAAIGRSSLKHIECLNTVAELWTKKMVDAGGISHNPNLANEVQYVCGGAWSILGENVGVGYDSAGLFNAFMASPGHRVNIEDSRFTRVGAGAYYKSDGRLFVTQVFANCSSCTSPWNTNASLPADPVSSTSSAARWSGWENLGGILQTGTSPTAASWSSSRIDVFVQGTNNDLHQKYWNGSGWYGFYNLGGREIMAPNSSPAAVSWGPNRIDVFARSKSNTLIHKWWDGTRWSGWEDLGGTITSAPAASSWASGRLDVFARGSDGTLHHKWYSNKWGGWESLGGGILGAPTAVSWGTNRIDIFVRGTNDGIHQKAWGGSSWSDWINHGGVTYDSPGVASWASGRLDLFVRGTTNSVYQKYYSGSWSGWNRLDSQQLTSGISAVSFQSNRVDVFARGPNGELLHKWYPN
jgi:uncharacterized protein YkwD